MPSNTKEYQKKYYALNKQKQLDKMKEKVCCEHCKKMISRSHISNHMKTKKCTEKVSQLNENGKSYNEKISAIINKLVIEQLEEYISKNKVSSK